MKATIRNKNFHVPLPDDTYLALREAAERLKKPATQIVRDVVESWIKEWKKEILRQELVAYVETNAGSRYDLDPELEAAGVDHLLKTEEGKQ